MVKLLGVFVFAVTALASCGAVRYVSSEVLNPEQTQFPDGVPPTNFLVAFHNRAAGKDEDAFGAAPWKHAHALMAKEPGQFRLPVKEFRSQRGDPFSFKVLEETPDSQVVEMSRADYGTIKTRYRIEGKRITPLSYRTDGGIGQMAYLFPVYLLCLLLAFVAAKLSTRWMRRVKPPEKEQ